MKLKKLPGQVEMMRRVRKYATRCGQVFTDRKKELNKRSCRGRVRYD